MPKFAIDTNVLVVASIANRDPTASNHHVPEAERTKVLEWLSTFRKDRASLLVLDTGRSMMGEYTRLLSTEDLGRRVVTEKWSTGGVVPVEVFDQDGALCLPPEVVQVLHEVTDQTVAAAAFVDSEKKTVIVNSCDSDWVGGAEAALKQHRVVVLQLNRVWLEATPKGRAKAAAHRAAAAPRREPNRSKTKHRARR